MKPENSVSSDERFAAKELQKLELEIISLRKKNSLLAQLIPLLATLAGVAGVLLTVFTFRAEQRAEHDRMIIEQQKDRTSKEVEQIARFQNQIRNDIDELLSAALDEKQTISKVSFLLEDIETVLESSVTEGKPVSSIFPGYRRTVTESLAILIRDDLDFTERPRDVGLANTIIVHWTDYSAYLREDREMLEYILYEYIRALENLRDQNSGYLQGMKVNPSGIDVDPLHERRKGEAALYNYFNDLAYGFRLHVAVIDGGNSSREAEKLKERHLRDFQAALCNQDVSKYLLGTHFPDEPCGRDRSNPETLRKGREP